MKVELTTWERLMIGSLAGAQSGPVELIEKCFAVRAAVRLKMDELVEIGARYVSSGLRFDDSINAITQELSVDKKWDVVVPDEVAEFMCDLVVNHETWRGEDAERVLPLDKKMHALKEKKP